MSGGRYLAEDRGAFDQAECSAAVEAAAEVETIAATAPLYEVAAAHDGQPAVEWLRMFYRVYGGAA